ncbi:MAG: helix-turn-helix transcriptional regulator [Nibricoccus sp.]
MPTKPSTSVATAFGLVLRKHREAKGWSQMQLAMEADMHLNAVGNLERGTHNPSLRTVFILCRAMGVPTDKFVKEVEQRLGGHSNL